VGYLWIFVWIVAGPGTVPYFVVAVRQPCSACRVWRGKGGEPPFTHVARRRLEPSSSHLRPSTFDLRP